MLFGRACRESKIEGKLFKFHWHIERHLSPRASPSGWYVRARARPDASHDRASRRVYTMACGCDGNGTWPIRAPPRVSKPKFPRTYVRSYDPQEGREEGFQGFRPLWYKPFPFVTNGNERVSSPRFLVGGPYTVGGWWKRRLGFNLIERLRRSRGSFFFFYERLGGKNCLGNIWELNLVYLEIDCECYVTCFGRFDVK